MPTPAAHSTPSISADVEPIVEAKGGIVLPYKNHFLEIEHLFELLRSEQEMMEGIPEGTKENAFYIINNAANLLRRKYYKFSQFIDDCGSWASGPTNLTLFVFDDGILTRVTMKDSLYGTTCTKRVTGGRHVVFTALSRQPLPHEVIHLHKAYAKHKHDESYRRRISWTDDKPVAVVEYLGTFPRFGPHGGDLGQRSRRTNPVTDHSETSEEMQNTAGIEVRGLQSIQREARYDSAQHCSIEGRFAVHAIMFPDNSIQKANDKRLLITTHV